MTLEAGAEKDLIGVAGRVRGLRDSSEVSDTWDEELAGDEGCSEPMTVRALEGRRWNGPDISGRDCWRLGAG